MMDGAVKFIVPADKRECSYIGFDLQTDSAQFVFPCKYIEDTAADDVKKTEARKILSLIKKVQQEYFFGGDGSQTLQFFAMTWLVRDFVDNGYYTEREDIIKKGGKGAIDWKRTIKNNAIYIDNGNIIYREIFTHKSMLNDGGTLAQIYKCCLEYSVKHIGFLYNVTRTERSVFDITSPATVNYMAHVVQSQLNQTFNSYKKVLLNHLLTILKGLQGRMKSISLSMRDSEFEYVFEFLINAVFGTDDVRNYYNEYTYHLVGERPYTASKLRPDTIMQNKSGKPDYFVIDAKYYNYGYTQRHGDLPQASSISKQIGYNAYLKKNDGEQHRDFYSVFMLPYAKGSDGATIKYIGYATNRRDGADDGKKISADRIAVCLIDLRTLTDAYFGEGVSGQQLKRELIDAVLRPALDTDNR